MFKHAVCMPMQIWWLYDHVLKLFKSEYDQEVPQSHTVEKRYTVCLLLHIVRFKTSIKGGIFCIHDV